ncbi:MAG: NAD(P)/FAD-dependent oxidoreductase [Bacillota bacterium]|nr:NAD(P)/FAD-dependent oxidoreductase [Bacillota bacterium]
MSIISPLHQNYDVIVVGAGPAGALCAALTAKAGLKTLILEKRSLPRQKICGGFISKRSLALLPADFSTPPQWSEPINEIAVCMRNKIYSYISGEALGLMVKRESFDQQLAAYAVECGAELIEDSPVIDIRETAGEADYIYHYMVKAGLPEQVPFIGRFLVGADGANGTTAYIAGLRGTKTINTGWGISEIINKDPGDNGRAILKFYPLPLLGGMAWSFETSHWVNRGLGGLVSPKTLRNKYTKLFHQSESVLKAWPIPFMGPYRKAAKNNLVLIGDAAGLAEPFSGEGLYNSFSSACYAASAIIEADDTGSIAGPIYNRYFLSHFRSGFLPSIAGTFILHGRSLISPSFLPKTIATLMDNKLWFNRSCKLF